MSATVKVRNTVLGMDIPKICVPLVEKKTTGLVQEIGAASESSADLAEWRADHFAAANDIDALLSAAKRCREAAGDMPLLFTHRSDRERGAGRLSHKEYLSFNLSMANSGFVDMVDVELSAGQNICAKVRQACREKGVAMVLSSHDFTDTPPLSEMIARFGQMADLGANVAKLAVMPRSPKDVLSLMEAGYRATESYGERCLVVAISMGELGKISRISGRVFGSCMTFATVKAASAPGQLSVEEVRAALSLI